MTLRLFDDQLKVKQGGYNSLRTHQSTLLQCPTGFGKSMLAVSFCMDAIANNRRVTINVPRIELARQLGNSLTRFNIPHGYQSSKFKPNAFAPIQIATTDTLEGLIDRVHTSNLLIVDECHVGGDSLSKIIHHYKPQGKKVIGLSATPQRMDGKGMDTYFDDMVCGPQMRWLIDNGRLNDYKLYAPSSAKQQAMIAHLGDMDGDFEFDNQMFGDASGHYKQFAMGKRNLVFCRSVKHAKDTAEYFTRDGIPSAAIWGTMPQAEMLRRVKAFARRDLLCLMGVEIFTFGWDLSQLTGMDANVESISLLRNTDSLPLYMQIVGRALRKSDDPSYIFDHVGAVARHGLPCAPREWSLDGKLKGEGKAKEKTVPVRQCPIGDGGCGFVHRPAPYCPACGFKYPIRSVDMELVDETLVEIDKSMIAWIAKQERQVQGRAKEYEDLLELEKRTGKGYGWADRVYAGRGNKLTRDQFRMRRKKWEAINR